MHVPGHSGRDSVEKPLDVTISVTVRDGETEEPVDDATVALEADGIIILRGVSAHDGVCVLQLHDAACTLQTQVGQHWADADCFVSASKADGYGRVRVDVLGARTVVRVHVFLDAL